MLNLILAFAVLGFCLLVAGVVWLNLWVEHFTRGGMIFWRLRSDRRVYCGGSFYRSSRRL